MGFLSQTPLRDTVVDFSYPHSISRNGFLTKKPSHLPKVTAILWPYESAVWISLSVTLPAFCFVYWIYSKIDRKGFTPDFTLGKAASQINKMLLNQGKQNTHPTVSCTLRYSTCALPRYKSMAFILGWQNFIVVLGFLCSCCVIW